MNSNTSAYGPDHLASNHSTKRIEYIDALRGLVMVMVVFHHVGDCWGIIGLNVSIHEYLLQLIIPTFFFISGFVLYRDVTWNAAHIIDFFRKKVTLLLIVPFLFFVLFIHGESIIDQFCNHFKQRYWFTFVLFDFYVFYAVIHFCIRKWWSDIVLVALGVFLYFINHSVIYDSIPLPELVKGMLSVKGWNYFIFFALGTLAKKHFVYVENWLKNSYFLAVCILFYFLVNGFSKSVIDENSALCLPLSISAIIVLFAFFRNNQGLFRKETVVGGTLQYIGKRTLDVYLIHIFLLPYNLEFISVFKEHPMPVIEATVSLIIAGIIIAFSLVISNIIRLSPLLAHWLFGAKLPPKSTNTPS